MDLKGNNYNLVSNSRHLTNPQNPDLIIALEQFLQNYKEANNYVQTIPLSHLTCDSLGILEGLVKYLKENQKLSFHEIGVLLNRNDRTIWASYNKACSKQKIGLKTQKEDIQIPLHIFAERKIGPLEALVKHLKEIHGFSFKDIALLLNRNYRNIWVSYNNSKKRGGRNE